MARDEGRTSIHYIPRNFSNGFNFLGFNFKVRNLLEGIVLGTIGGFLMFMLLVPVLHFDIGTSIGSALAILIAGIVFGIIGINDEPISQYFINYMRYKNHKRTAFYNPRVKLESITYKDIKAKKDQDKLENKLKSKINKLKDKQSAKDAEKIQNNEINNYFDAEKIFFKDDEGIIKKPKEYMDDKELQNYEKEQEAREKHIIKLAKQIEKEERYKNG